MPKSNALPLGHPTIAVHFSDDILAYNPSRKVGLLELRIHSDRQAVRKQESKNQGKELLLQSPWIFEIRFHCNIIETQWSARHMHLTPPCHTPAWNLTWK